MRDVIARMRTTIAHIQGTAHGYLADSLTVDLDQIEQFVDSREPEPAEPSNVIHIPIPAGDHNPEVEAVRESGDAIEAQERATGG